jgi:hypothetical protein
MFATLILAAVVQTSPSCEAMEKRAGILAHPHTVDGTEGLVQIVAMRQMPNLGPLTYAFAKSNTQPPVCSGEAVTLERPGFTFMPSSPQAFAALQQVYSTSVARDFAHSALVATTHLGDETTQWYRGTMNGYSTRAGSNSLSVMTLVEFDNALSGARSVH